jgi:hypothetical protein
MLRYAYIACLVFGTVTFCQDRVKIFDVIIYQYKKNARGKRWHPPPPEIICFKDNYSKCVPERARKLLPYEEYWDKRHL